MAHKRRTDDRRRHGMRALAVNQSVPADECWWPTENQSAGDPVILRYELEPCNSLIFKSVVSPEGIDHGKARPKAEKLPLRFATRHFAARCSLRTST